MPDVWEPLRSHDLTWYLGTMGYGYRDWQNGIFYPEGLAKNRQLSRYSEVFNAVEMDNTFYAIPAVDQVKRWGAQVPAGFQFCPKTPRDITHESRLAQSDELMAAFLSAMRHFEDKLGIILIQFPPDFTRINIDDVASFLAKLPTDLRYAVEFRHRSWHAAVTGEMLQAHNICWVSAEYLYMPQRIYKTTDFFYVRFLGRHGTFEHKTHEQIDRGDRLEAWWIDIQQRAEGINTVYTFFNNDYSGHSPTTCNRFKSLVGLPTVPTVPSRQQRLL